MNIEALHKYLTAVASKEFKLGNYDCVRFVTECVYIGWDKDYRDVLDYDSRKSAVRRLRKAGGLEYCCDEAMGRRLSPEEFQVGDVAYYDEPAATIGLVMPGHVAVKSGRTIHRFSIDYARFGWRP